MNLLRMRNISAFLFGLSSVLSAGLAGLACSSTGDGNPPAPTATANALFASQPGLFGDYDGVLIKFDEGTEETLGSQEFNVTIAPSSSKSDPREVATIHLESDGEFFQKIDFKAPLDIELNGRTFTDGSKRYEFLTEASVIPGLAGKNPVRLEVVVILGAGEKVDSSQSSIRILDCGLSGNAVCSELYPFADFGGFGKR